MGDPGIDETSNLKDLHERLYRKGNSHPGLVYYLIVCRMIMGHAVRTQSGSESALDLEHEQPVYATAQKRELAAIPGSRPQVHYHSLVAELGGDVKRFREFVQFRDGRIYPEYILAYSRDA